MLTLGLVLSRDLLLSGAASLALDNPKVVLERAPKWSGPGGLPDRAIVEKAIPGAHLVKSLQSNVRANLAEMELLSGLSIVDATSGGAPPPGLSGRSVTVRTSVEGADNKSIATGIATLRSPNASVFANQLKLVGSYADLRAERVNEILSQVVPQTAYWSALAGLGPERHRYTWELLGIGLRFAMLVVMKCKFLLNCARPMEYSAVVQPIILTPGYTAYPSGHATEAYFIAELLPELMPGNRLDFRSSLDEHRDSLRYQLHRLAFRIAENRVVAGLHFPIDSLAGQLLGVMLARYFLACCGAASRKVGGEFPFGWDNSKHSLETCEPTLDRFIDTPADQGSLLMTAPKTTLDPGVLSREVLRVLYCLAVEECLS